MNCLSSGKSLLSGICHFLRACKEKFSQHRRGWGADRRRLGECGWNFGGDKLQLLSIPLKILPLTCRAGSFFQLSYPATKTGTLGSKPVTYRLRLLQANTETLLATQKAFCTCSLLFTHQDPGVKLPLLFWGWKCPSVVTDLFKSSTEWSCSKAAKEVPPQTEQRLLQGQSWN